MTTASDLSLSGLSQDFILSLIPCVLFWYLVLSKPCKCQMCRLGTQNSKQETNSE
jgi:hypothetical protein